jgi:hypothetical protein
LTHWSSRRLADWLAPKEMIKVSHDSISRLWRRFCLQPHRTEGFKFFTDPQLDAKVTDVVGMYLSPPDDAVVVCVDEKSRCQALEPTSQSCRCGGASPSGRPMPTPAQGVTCLFAALNTATSQVTDACHPRHRHQPGGWQDCQPDRAAAA